MKIHRRILYIPTIVGSKIGKGNEVFCHSFQTFEIEKTKLNKRLSIDGG